MTGLSGAGKTTIAEATADILRLWTEKTEVIDGDIYRRNLCKDLGFSRKDRIENLFRLGFVADVLAKHSIHSIIAAISPYQQIREELFWQYGAFLVWVKCSLEEVKRRDVKGLYNRACLSPSDPYYVSNFTGISAPFEEPKNAALILDTEKLSIEQCAIQLADYIMDCKYGRYLS